jgi:CheY-like chemotaxis protein
MDLNSLIPTLHPMLKHLLGKHVHVDVLPVQDLRQIRADRNQMEQVLVNLALNAKDAMPAGGRFIVETRNVTFGPDDTARRPYVVPGDYVQMSATDTGCGMDQETARRVFEPFFTTKEVGKGTGLGLATCYGIVKQAGGYMWVHSEPGKGTCFTILLPAIPEISPSQAPAVKEAKPPSGAGTVLVAEDEESLLLVATRCLSGLGYHVLQASDGREALRVAEGYTGRIDLLLSDVVMPEMDGRRLASLIRESRPEVKVVFMSGYATAAVHSVAELAADAIFLQKPFTPRALAQCVHRAIDSLGSAPQAS